MITDILSHFESVYPEEGCGLLAIVNEELTWFPCKNASGTPETDFEIAVKDYFEVALRHKVVGVVHSHPTTSSQPSKMDVANCNALGVNYYIFSLRDGDITTVEPEKTLVPLKGREYIFGLFDCYEAAKDFYKVNLGYTLPTRPLFEDNWWKKGLNYFTEKRINDWGFSKVEEAQPGDLLIFSIHSKVPNHCGVYVGENTFYHHAVNRLSCTEELAGIWKQTLTGVYRYGT